MYKWLLSLRILLCLGAIFFFFEFVLHLLGLPILEHDRIFIPTHDRYIALYALTYAALLLLSAYQVGKYKPVFFIVMIGILFGIINATLISRSGGYEVLFPTLYLDDKLSGIGVGAVFWYIAVWFVWWRSLYSASSS